MLVSELHAQVYDEESALRFLQSLGLFTEETIPCPGKENKKCEGIMRKTIRKTTSGTKTPTWRCNKKHCQMRRSIRSTNSFFTFRTSKGKNRTSMKLQHIIILVYEWLFGKMTLDELQIRTGHARATLVDWLGFFRNVCTTALTHRDLFRGTADQPVQIDESYFSGKRKNNVGRYRKGNHKLKNDKKLIEEEIAENGPPTPHKTNKNHGGQVEGPWVFGIYQSSETTRFFHMGTGN